MPLDFRRLQVPADSEGYRKLLKKDVQSYEHELNKIFNENKIRNDGRTCENQRKMCKFYFFFF